MTPQEAYLTVCSIKPKDFQRDSALEAAIIQSPDYAHRYAFHFLKGPWPEAEPMIRTDPLVWDWYQADTLKTKALEWQ